MKTIFRLIFNRWTLAILGLIAVGFLIWWVGPMIAIDRYRPLESELTRTIAIAAIVVIYLARVLWSSFKAYRANAQLMKGIAQPPAQLVPATDRAGAEEVAALQGRFDEAIGVLKQANKSKSGWRALLPGKQYLYDLPWYVFIGAPGCGKTTALVNSGLQFPLAERLGQQKIRGIGGTRNCDWWFSDQAVFIDTAGRFTTQESDEKSDKAAWAGFLQLLKKHRPRRPINGAIVTISAADLLQLNPTELEQQAAALRSRIRELHEELGIRFPVYVLVTKADLLSGFIEFFSEFGREERAQVWGVSFPTAGQEGVQLPKLSDELIALEARLNDRLVDRLQQERDPQARALIYTFPQQFAVLKLLLADFLAQVFEPSRYEAQPMVRGVYFTSGTQEGSPIDRIMGQLARALHLEQQLVAPNRPSGRSYFITRLINEIMLPEAGLAGTNLKWERRRTALQLGVLAVAALVTIGAIAVWTISYSRNSAYVSDVEANLEKVQKQVGELEARPSTDVVALLPTLEAVRNLAQASDTVRGEKPLGMGFGLYQGDKLGVASKSAYRRLLQDAFLPRIQARLEEQLRTGGQQNPELQYETLKAYVMLSDARHFDAEALKTFITLDWDSSLPREVTREQRSDLASHLDALLSQGAIASPIIADAELIESARNAIARTPIQQRAYNRLRRLGIGANLPEFTVAGAAGPAGSLVFARESGQPLTRGVPGLFTYKGYYDTFRPAAERVTTQLADEESWVLGTAKNDARLLDSKSGEDPVTAVRRIFLEEYARTWEQFINDIKIVHAGSLQDVINSTKVLSAPDSSPLPKLLKAIADEVTLVRTDDPNRSLIDTAKEKLSGLNATKDELTRLYGKVTGQQATSAKLPLEQQIVDSRFENLRRVVKEPAPGKPAPIQDSIALLNDLYTYLESARVAMDGNLPPPPNQVGPKIKAEAARLPEPLRSVLAIVAADAAQIVLGGSKENITKAMSATVTDFCVRATKDRYPFVKTSSLDVTQDDFTRLFAPGGLLDDFFQKNLAQYVDTSARPWKFRKIGEAVMGTSSASLVQFQRAQTIRDALFRTGPRPGLRLEFKPLEMDTTITQFILDVDGQLVKYSHGPQVPVTVQWPGPRGSMQVRLELSPKTAGVSGQVFEGPWALFRMLDGTKIEAASQPEKFIVTFDVDSRKSKFEVLTNSVENPFRLDALARFQCPGQL